MDIAKREKFCTDERAKAEEADLLRELLGVEAKNTLAEQDPIITNSVLVKLASALLDPEKRAQIVRVIAS